MNSPIAYVGGKSRLAKTIIPMIPTHQTYCEVFAGAGWVFFKKDASRFETLNDLDGDLISFYKVIKHHLEEFLKQFEWVVCSREWFEEWNEQIKSEKLTDIQRAAMYYYIQRLCFGGRVRGRTFGVSLDRPPRVPFSIMEEELYQVHLRLRACVIEHLPWQEFITRYDRQDVFFFIDPPYYTKPEYRYNMALEDFKELSERLRGVKGRFLLTINDHPVMRETFGSFEMKEVSLRYSASRDTAPIGHELIFTNYHPAG
jgi:DNA adenine methylase